MDSIATFLSLPTSALIAMAAICFAAGVVRGFTGFALSALVMASAALILPPVELIPMLWWLEMGASLLMLKGGWQDADRGVAIALVIGSAIGVPLGLALTVSVSPDISRLIALGIIVTLAAMQLAKIRLPALNSKPGLYGSGVTAGIVTGLAGVGGMVVALYVLAQDRPARVMRASLVLFLFGGSLTSMITHIAYGTMDAAAVWRGLAFTVPTLIGVYLGQRLFIPRFEPWYRPICLSLLIGLAAWGILRLLL